jgi:hypothetical protein
MNRSSALYLLFGVAAWPLLSQQRDDSAEALTSPEQAALADLDESKATRYPLIDSWFQERPIQYYHFGPSTVQPSSLYRVQGGGVVVSTLPGLPGYSALRQVFDLEVRPNAGVSPAAIKSHEAILRLLKDGRAVLRATGLILNLPIVPQGSTLERDPEARQLQTANYKGRSVRYFDFGINPAGAIPLFAFASGLDRNGQLEQISGQASNASGIPGMTGYSDLWAVDAAIGSGYQPGSYRDYRRAALDARGGRLRLISRGVQNCPVVYVEGRPAVRVRAS